MLKAVVFDLDETLIHSKEAILRFFRELYAAVGLDFPEGAKEFFYTASEKDLLGRVIADPGLLARAEAFKRAYASERYLGDLRLKPFAREALDALHGRYLLALATNRGLSTPAVLEHFDLARYFEVVVHARSLAEPKPHPLVMRTILAKLGVAAGETLVVGDSKVDVQTARNAGSPCVIVGEHAREGLGDHALDDLSGLAALVESLHGDGRAVP